MTDHDTHGGFGSTDRRQFMKAASAAGTAGLVGLAGCTGGGSNGGESTDDGDGGDSAGITFGQPAILTGGL